jgi:hypothetical protein
MDGGKKSKGRKQHILTDTPGSFCRWSFMQQTFMTVKELRR